LRTLLQGSPGRHCQGEVAESATSLAHSGRSCSAGGRHCPLARRLVPAHAPRAGLPQRPGQKFRRRAIQLRPWPVINTAGQFRLEKGERAQVISGPALKRFTVSVNRLRQLSARGLGSPCWLSLSPFRLADGRGIRVRPVAVTT
jgi:hypothetical protein